MYIRRTFTLFASCLFAMAKSTFFIIFLGVFLLEITLGSEESQPLKFFSVQEDFDTSLIPGRFPLSSLPA